MVTQHIMSPSTEWVTSPESSNFQFVEQPLVKVELTPGKKVWPVIGYRFDTAEEQSLVYIYRCLNARQASAQMLYEISPLPDAPFFSRFKAINDDPNSDHHLGIVLFPNAVKIDERTANQLQKTHIWLNMTEPKLSERDRAVFLRAYSSISVKIDTLPGPDIIVPMGYIGFVTAVRIR